MTSERQKREEEIERLLRDAAFSKERNVAFEEQVRKAAAAIGEREARRIQKTERPRRLKRPLGPATAGVWLLVLGAGLAFSVPNVGAVVILCGIGLMVWAAVLKSSKK
jgi:hypothetical protein